jgi:bifunctional non-homologous end joining protein LigD
MRPMLATRGDTVPTGPDWVHEVKWDGMRVLAEVSAGTLRLWSRNENDVTVSFPELHDVGVLAAHDVLLDGEVVAMAGGIPTFAALADRMHVANAARARSLAHTNPVTLMVFDVLRLDGRDLTAEPLSARRAALESLQIGSAHWQVPPTYDDGKMLCTVTREQGLEGVVSKRLSSTYRFDHRTKDWLKFPNRMTYSCVVGGWRRETGSDTRLGALLVGQPTARGLSYRGRVGSGIAGKTAQRLLEALGPLQGGSSPFCDDVPQADATGTTWVRPTLVVEVAALGVTEAGRLRQPSYQGIRFDLAPSDLAPSDLGE